MRIEVDIERAADVTQWVPSDEQVNAWVSNALQVGGYSQTAAEVSIRIVSESESQASNYQYRGKDKPTNILSFPADIPDFIELPLLGDLLICAPVVALEAEQQSKPDMHHWAHLVTHGILHLLGFDHQTDAQAEVMEGLEIKALSQFDIPDPYTST